MSNKDSKPYGSGLLVAPYHESKYGRFQIVDERRYSREVTGKVATVAFEAPLVIDGMEYSSRFSVWTGALDPTGARRWYIRAQYGTRFTPDADTELAELIAPHIRDLLVPLTIAEIEERWLDHARDVVTYGIGNLIDQIRVFSTPNSGIPDAREKLRNAVIEALESFEVPTEGWE